MSASAQNEASASKSATLDMVKEAQSKQLAVVNGIRRQLIQALTDLDEIGGKDKPEDSLLDIINGFPQGIPYPFLRNLFEDAVLVGARDALKKKGAIKQDGKRGDDVTLKPIVPNDEQPKSVAASGAAAPAVAVETVAK